MVRVPRSFRGRRWPLPCPAAAGGDISEGAQLLGDGDECGSDRLGIQARRAEDARYHAQAGLGGKQGLHAGVLAIGADAADDRAVGRGFILARLHSHHNGRGVGLVGDRLQAGGQRTASASLTDGGLNVGDEYRRIEREGGGVGVVGGGYQADDRGGDGANGAGPVVDLLDPDTVMVLVSGHWVCLCSGWMTLHRLPRARPSGDTPVLCM